MKCKNVSVHLDNPNSYQDTEKDLHSRKLPYTQAIPSPTSPEAITIVTLKVISNNSK